MKDKINIEVDKLSSLFMISITDNAHNTYKYDIRDELTIDEHNLSKDLREQPSKYMYWASILEKARSYYEASSIELERIYAKLYEPCRLKSVAQGVQRPTKDQINSLIIQEEEYIKAQDINKNYEMYVKQLQYVVRAFESRKDMLIQLATDERKQKEYETAINQNW